MCTTKTFPTFQLVLDFISEEQERQGTTFKNDHTAKQLKTPLSELNFDPFDFSKHRLRFDNCGRALVNVSSAIMHCLYGKDHHTAHKRKEKQRRSIDMDQDHPVVKKTRMSTQNTKKLGCPAAIKISRCVIFQGFVVSIPNVEM